MKIFFSQKDSDNLQVIRDMLEYIVDGSVKNLNMDQIKFMSMGRDRSSNRDALVQKVNANPMNAVFEEENLDDEEREEYLNGD